MVEVTWRAGITGPDGAVARDESPTPPGRQDPATWTRHRHPLGKLPLLAGVPSSVVMRLGSLMTPVTFPAGQVLVRQGARNSQFVLIDQGTVRVTRDGATVAELGVGEFVGELSLLGDGHANATVTTLTEVEAYVSSSVEFEALLHSALGRSIQAEAVRRSA